VLSPAVVEAARFPEFDLPDPPDEHPYKLRREDGYVIVFMPDFSFAGVHVRRVAAEEVILRVAEVREFLTDQGFERAAWVLSEAAEPAGIVELLKKHDLVPWPEGVGGYEPRYRQMALASEPAKPAGVVARPVETREEFVAAQGISRDAFNMSEQDRRLVEERDTHFWELEQRHPEFRTYAAFVDDEIVGHASVIFGAKAAYMSGSAVRPDHRGRGVYRALVHARWNAAVECNTPALTVGAGAMSAPILDRIGFTTVGWVDVLSDDLSKLA
jgi:GNAT superfamily N-acetyltransferase